MRDVLAPLPADAVLSSVMVTTLNALQQRAHVLIRTMDVFITEPLVDWRQNATRQARAEDRQETAEGMPDLTWYPQQKASRVETTCVALFTGALTSDHVARAPQVATAAAKLRLANPAGLVVRDLELGFAASNQPLLQATRAIVRGDIESHVRARVGDKCADVAQQVACLVEMATDDGILGRAWGGWEPWV